MSLHSTSISIPDLNLGAQLISQWDNQFWHKFGRSIQNLHAGEFLGISARETARKKRYLNIYRRNIELISRKQTLVSQEYTFCVPISSSLCTRPDILNINIVIAKFFFISPGGKRAVTRLTRVRIFRNVILLPPFIL